MWFVVLVLLCIVLWLLSRSATLAHELKLLRGRVEVLEGAAQAPATAPAHAPVQAPAQQPEIPLPPMPAPVPAPATHVAPAASSAPAPAPLTFESAGPAEPAEPPAWQRALAEHALAIAGGVFVLAAAVFFVGYAVDQGWIGPQLRIALALCFGAALVGVGLRIASRLPAAERDGRAIGSLHGVLAGVGVGVMVLAIVSAVRIEEVMSAPVGVVGEVLVAAAAVLVARRWRSQDLAAFGIVAALAAPILLDAPPDSSTVLLLAVALVGAAVLVVWEQWPRLLAVAALVTAPQLLGYVFDSAASDIALASVTIGWWAILALAAIAQVLRSTGDATRSIATTLLAAPAVVAGALSVAFGDELAEPGWRTGFTSAIVAFGVVQLLLALAARSRRPTAITLQASLVGAGVTSLALAVADGTSDAATAFAWSAEAVVMALLWWVAGSRISAAFAAAATALAAYWTFTIAAPPTLLAGTGAALLDPLLATAGVVVALLAARVLIHFVPAAEARAEVAPVARRVLDGAAAVVGWYAIAILLVQLSPTPTDTYLLGSWAALAGLGAAWASSLLRREELAFLAVGALFVEATSFLADHHGTGRALLAYAAFTFVALAPLLWVRVADVRPALLAAASQVVLASIVVLEQLPPDTLRAWDSGSVLDATWILLAWLSPTALLAYAARVAPERRVERTAVGFAALAALYAISVLVVGAATDRPGVVEQAPQVALTLTWVALGIAVLVAGTTPRYRAHGELRMAAYGLLALAGAKLVLLDTAELETPARVLAFLATGLGLLGAAWLEQRMRRGAEQ